MKRTKAETPPLMRDSMGRAVVKAAITTVDSEPQVWHYVYADGVVDVHSHTPLSPLVVTFEEAHSEAIQDQDAPPADELANRAGHLL